MLLFSTLISVGTAGFEQLGPLFLANGQYSIIKNQWTSCNTKLILYPPYIRRNYWWCHQTKYTNHLRVPQPEKWSKETKWNNFGKFQEISFKQYLCRWNNLDWLSKSLERQIHNGKPNLPLFATQAPYYRYINQTKCNGGTEVTCVAGPHLIRTYTRIARKRLYYYGTEIHRRDGHLNTNLFFSNGPADHYSYFLR